MDNQQAEQAKTAGEVGWHASRYNLYAQVPGTKMMAITNLYRGICAEYTHCTLASARSPRRTRILQLKNPDEQLVHRLLNNRAECVITGLPGTSRAQSGRLCPT